MAMTETPPETMAAMPTNASPSGLPQEQLQTWLEWVQEDLRRVEARCEYLEAARTQLREQERLLTELIHSSGPLTARR
jgi:hypothetical protein